jgi:hypothetical protein
MKNNIRIAIYLLILLTTTLIPSSKLHQKPYVAILPVLKITVSPPQKEPTYGGASFSLADTIVTQPSVVASSTLNTQAVSNCGSDPNMAYVYTHESGCNTASINASSGACGLGQAYPCSKLPCSLSDWTCQNNYFTAYAVARYGSTYAAMLYWEANSNW